MIVKVTIITRNAFLPEDCLRFNFGAIGCIFR